MSAKGSTLCSPSLVVGAGAAISWIIFTSIGCSNTVDESNDTNSGMVDAAQDVNDVLTPADSVGNDQPDTASPGITGCFSDQECTLVFPSPPACQTAKCNLIGNFCYIGDAPDELFCSVTGQACGGKCKSGECAPLSCAEVCSNGMDDDFDGKNDCDDTDCTQSPDCVSKLCNPGFAVSCETELIASTLGPGSWKSSAAYDCVAWKMDGPERVYRIAPGGIANYSVKLLAKAVDLRLVVVEEDPTQPCGRGRCVAYGEETASWVAQPDRAYLVVVDGYAGAAGAFALRFDCAAPVEWSCHDGADDDGDGAIDCDDPDCEDAPWCATCVPLIDLACGSTLTYVTDSPISTQSIDTYSCTQTAGWDNLGREISFRVPAPNVPIAYKANLTTASENHHLIVLPESSDGKCNPDGCIHAGKTVEWTQNAGEAAFLVVDGPNGPGVAFDLDLECVLNTELDCFNGVDDDKDGDVDCADSECLTNEACNVCKPSLSLACNSQVFLSTAMPLATSNLSGGDCSGGDSDGPEIVMTFTSGIQQPVRILVHDANNPTSLGVMERIDSAPCNPSNCVDFSDWSVLFTAESGTTYDIVVDTGVTTSTSFGLTVECGTPTELLCNNFADEDLDGLLDCADPDCQGLAGCTDCLPLFPITCGQTVKLPPINGLSTTNLSTYSCEETALDGPEVAFSLVTTNTSQATVTLQDGPPGSRLLALQSSPILTCDPLFCFDSAVDKLTVDVTSASDPVTVVVDTPGDEPISEIPIVLSVECLPGMETFCDDGWDNDSDGQIDCADPDCTQDLVCATCKANSVLSCGSVINGNLTIGGTVAAYGCTSGTDFDAHEAVWEISVASPLALNAKFFSKQPGMRMFLIDPTEGGPCSPESCITSSDQLLKQPLTPNKKYLLVVDGKKEAAGSFSIGTSCVGLAELCNNGADDDGDTMVDCQDPDCYSQPLCIPPENCTNGADDDLDTWIDCDDPDCSSLAVCNPIEICNNSTDDDGDGQTDCDDDDCDLFVACIPVEICDSLEDDDGDGFIDCEDTDCLFAPSCIVIPPEDCINGKDDDGDSFTDCADADCAGVGSCGQCTLTGVLYCGSKLNGTMTTGTTGNNMFLYPCDPGKVFGGPEKTFRINIGTAASATVLFSGSPELSGHHIEFAGAGCSLTACKSSYSGSSWVVPLTPKQGIAHYITLDSLATGNYNFNLDVQCN